MIINFTFIYRSFILASCRFLQLFYDAYTHIWSEKNSYEKYRLAGHEGCSGEIVSSVSLSFVLQPPWKKKKRTVTNIALFGSVTCWQFSPSLIKQGLFDLGYSHEKLNCSNLELLWAPPPHPPTSSEHIWKERPFLCLTFFSFSYVECRLILRCWSSVNVNSVSYFTLACTFSVSRL